MTTERGVTMVIWVKPAKREIKVNVFAVQEENGTLRSCARVACSFNFISFAQGKITTRTSITPSFTSDDNLVGETRVPGANPSTPVTLRSLAGNRICDLRGETRVVEPSDHLRQYLMMPHGVLINFCSPIPDYIRNAFREFILILKRPNT